MIYWKMHLGELNDFFYFAKRNPNKILFSNANRTEFHMKFLWGSKGALANAVDRHAKLEQVLTLMAEKFCHSDPIGMAA